MFDNFFPILLANENGTCVFEICSFVSRVYKACLVSLSSAQRQEQLKNYNLVSTVYRTLLWRSLLSLLSGRMETYAYSASFLDAIEENLEQK